MARAEDVFAILKKVRFPGLDHDIVSLGYVKEVGREGDRISIRIEISSSDAGAVAAIERDARRELDAAGLNYDLQLDNPATAAPTGDRAAEGKPVQTEDVLPEVRYKIAVASGKGGVGKSTVAVNLALALAEQEARVGLLDADIYGPSLPTMLGVTDQQPVMVDDKVAPIRAFGLKAMSLGFLATGSAPIIWRGPLAARAIEQLLRDVDWSGIDYLILDLPPGTGDIQISISQKGNLTGAIVVTTPQDVAMLDAIKGVRMFQKMDVPVLGIVENMSHFNCPHCGERSEIFPPGRLRAEIEAMGVPFACHVPIDPALPAGGDSGRPILTAAPKSATAEAFRGLGAKIVETLAACQEA
jgi:ATP-binding protein involved in chromosome partitioning